jgi:hypothetical protein
MWRTAILIYWRIDLTFMGPCIFDVFYLYNPHDASYKIFFITVNAVHVPGGFSARHQELKNCKHSIGYMSGLLAATASVGELGGMVYR